MSDRDIILKALEKAESRMRTGQFLARAATGVLGFAAAAIFVRLWDLTFPLSAPLHRAFWIGWFVALAAFLLLGLRPGRNLGRTAAEVDHKARLGEELLSAYWFLDRRAHSPWIDLQIQRAAATLSRLDFNRLYPWTLPRRFYAAAAAVALLAALHFAPLPLVADWGFARPAPAAAGTESIGEQMQAIEELLRAAEERSPAAPSAIEAFQALRQELESGALDGLTAARALDEMESLLTERNLNVSALLEGLEEIGADLMQAEESAAAGQALAEGDLGEAAQELSDLAEALAEGAAGSEALQQSLEEASANAPLGLEELVEMLRTAAEALAQQDAAAAAEALSGAAGNVQTLSDLVESQQLRNAAAERLEQLQEALRQAAQDGGFGEPTEGTPGLDEQSAGSGEAGGAAEEGAQGSSPALDGATEFAPGNADDGDIVRDADPSNFPSGLPGELEAGAGGETPFGFGFSPEEREGPPTSLEVQLLEQTVDALSTEDETGDEAREEASRRERSMLDYRNVPSELTPAQQELLNQDRIPREYRNLIKEYFQAIRPGSAP